MNSFWITVLLVIVCVVGGYFLSQYWIGFGWLGFLTGLILAGMYVYSRNQRIK